MALFKVFAAIAALLGGLSVAGGAFASHALKDRLSERMLEIFETGARYQMYHALALLAAALWLAQGQGNAGWLTAAGWAFIVGILFFSGSLYSLSFTGVKALGAIAPLGGAAFIAGWGCLVVAALTGK